MTAQRTLPCAYHAGLESEVRGLRDEVRDLSGRLWDVMEILTQDRPSQLAVIQAHRPQTPPGGTSVPPAARKVREQAGAWLVTVALALGLAVGLGLAAGVARSCGFAVPPPLGASVAP